MRQHRTAAIRRGQVLVALVAALLLLAACSPATPDEAELILTPPVPGIAFPRQKPADGPRVSMLAQLVGTLQREGACLVVRSLTGEVLLPVWPPEFTLRAQGEQLLVIDGDGRMAARLGEEVYLSGGYVGITDQWVLQQIPVVCRGETFVVGNEVRPNLRYDSDLFALDVISTAQQTALFLRYRAALDEQITDGGTIAGKLVVYEYDRCLHLQTESGPGAVTLLWPSAWSLRASDREAVVVDGTGQVVARVGDEVTLHGRAILHSMDVAPDRQLVSELPGDCIGASWLVDGVE